MSTDTVTDQTSIQVAYDRAFDFEFDRIGDSSGYWIRHKARRKGYSFHAPASVCAILDADNFRTTVGEVIDQYRKSGYGEFVTSNVSGPSANEVKPIIEDHWNKKNLAQVYEGIGRCLELAEPSHLPTLLRDEALPKFFGAHPDGKVIAVLHHDSATRQLSYLRGLYSLKHFSATDFKRAGVTSFETLNCWQFADPVRFVRANLIAANLAFYPFIGGFECGPYGLTLQFCFSKSIKQEPPLFPTDWLHKARSSVEFANEKRNFDDAHKERDSAEFMKLSHSRYLSEWHPDTDEFVSFVERVIDQSARLLFELLDPCNFTSDSVEIDSVWAFENFLSVDRLLRGCISALAADEPMLRKTSVFECAEILDTLSHASAGTAKTRFSKKLFHPKDAPALLVGHLQSIPDPIGPKLGEMVIKIYELLEKETIDSVWFPAKRTPQGILVKNDSLTSESVVAPGDFVADVMRDFRNSHHGYLTKTDPSARPSRRLMLTNGNVPDSITHLPLLWWFAYLMSLGSIVEWCPMRLNEFDG